MDFNRIISGMIRAARLDVSFYEEVEHDESRTQEALIVVIIASVAGAIGSFLSLLFGGSFVAAIGTLIYTGAKAGAFYVAVSTHPLNVDANDGATRIENHGGATNVTLQDLPAPATYYVTAFKDVDGNGKPDAWEPYGRYSTAPSPGPMQSMFVAADSTANFRVEIMDLAAASGTV